MHKENVLLILTVLGVISGSLLGVTLRSRSAKWTTEEISYLRFPGELFVKMLKMLILPLIMSSIITSLASVDSTTAGKLGIISLMYYFVTTFIAVFIGIALVTLIKPGTWYKTDIAAILGGQTKPVPCLSEASDTILDLAKSLFPENLIEATFRSEKVCRRYYNGSIELAADVVSNMSRAEKSMLREVMHLQKSDGMNILGLVAFSVAFGITISWIGDEGIPLKLFFKSLETVSMKLISLAIWYSPIGVLFLIATQIVSMTDPSAELQRLMGYMITVLLGLFIHGFIVLPLIMIILARRNPVKYVAGMTQALLTALATSSSSATLPLSIKCAEENNGVDPRVTRFVLPLGATINMDGTALYEAVAAIYISQCYERNLSIGEVILVSLTATLASIGAAGIPQAGIVTMIMVLIAIGLPSNLFILIFPIDFFLDRIRTTVNVHGDAIGAAVVAKLCESYLKKTPMNDPRQAAGGYHMLSQNASPDPKRITIANHNYENSHML